jgi:hypothetical protein
MSEDVHMENTTEDIIQSLEKNEAAKALSPEQLEAKQEWVKQFRLKFCVREEFEQTKNIILADGTLNQE